eukprot:1146135-Pelagomonas_calceolata.AAC.28
MAQAMVNLIDGNVCNIYDQCTGWSECARPSKLRVPEHNSKLSGKEYIAGTPPEVIHGHIALQKGPNYLEAPYVDAM